MLDVVILYSIGRELRKKGSQGELDGLLKRLQGARGRHMQR